MDSNLLYLLIGLIMGLLLGVNGLMLYNRFFNPKSHTEEKLRSRNRELEKKLKEKDHYISKAIKSIKEEKREKELIKDGKNN